MININLNNGAALILNYHQTVLLGKFKKDLIGVEMGVAFGGGVEDLGQMWRGVGKVYGFDTFEGHPEHLASDPNGIEARCMDMWYTKDWFGTKALSYEFQRSQLDAEGLSNVTLVKGLVHKDSCKDIPKIHYALLDMDIEASMRIGWEAIKDKIVPGGFVFIHDALPEDHIPAVHDWWYEEVLANDKSLKLIVESPQSFLVGCEKL